MDNQKNVLPTEIKGWGADLDPKNRPAVPKERIPARDIGVHWTEPAQQQSTVKVFHSNERPTMTPVFGTTVPPKGFSGALRGFAFKFSENDIRHWLILLFADRVDMVEGIVDDLKRGHIPNIFAEMGLKAEWKYNKKGLVKKAAIGTAVVAVAYLWMTRKSRSARA